MATIQKTGRIEEELVFTCKNTHISVKVTTYKNKVEEVIIKRTKGTTRITSMDVEILNALREAGYNLL